MLTFPLDDNSMDAAVRLIGSIRRQCLDHIIVFGAQNLRRALKRYVDYYNRIRTHLSLAKDAGARLQRRLSSLPS